MGPFHPRGRLSIYHGPATHCKSSAFWIVEVRSPPGPESQVLCNGEYWRNQAIAFIEGFERNGDFSSTTAQFPGCRTNGAVIGVLARTSRQVCGDYPIARGLRSMSSTLPFPIPTRPGSDP